MLYIKILLKVCFTESILIITQNFITNQKMSFNYLAKHLCSIIFLMSSFLGMQVLVDAREKLEIPWEHPSTHLAANQAILFRSNFFCGLHNDGLKST